MVFTTPEVTVAMNFGESIDLAPQNWVKIREFRILGVVLKLGFSAVGSGRVAPVGPSAIPFALFGKL